MAEIAFNTLATTLGDNVLDERLRASAQPEPKATINPVVDFHDKSAAARSSARQTLAVQRLGRHIGASCLES